MPPVSKILVLLHLSKLFNTSDGSHVMFHRILRFRGLALLILWLVAAILFLQSRDANRQFGPLYQMYLALPFLGTTLLCHLSHLAFPFSWKRFLLTALPGVVLLAGFLRGSPDLIPVFLFFSSFLLQESFLFWFLKRQSSVKYIPVKTLAKSQDFKYTVVRTNDSVRGTICVLMKSETKQCTVHVPFCPPFEDVPKILLKQVSSHDVKLNLVFVRPYGMKIDIRKNNLPPRCRAIVVKSCFFMNSRQ